MTGEFVPGVALPARALEAARVYAFRGPELLTRRAGDTDELPTVGELRALGLLDREPLVLGRLDGVDRATVLLPEEAAIPESFALSGLRALWDTLADTDFAVAGRGFQVLEWERTHRFCGVCGNPTEHLEGERGRRCPNCGHVGYPRLTPAVIVRIERDGELLLARGVRFPGVMYSVLAGFVDPGESLEECLIREVREEVGIEIADLTYFGSQSWPFPNSLMIGFTARYASGELTVDHSEIVDAGWFGRDNLPPLPGRLSIARRMIDAWIAAG